MIKIIFAFIFGLFIALLLMILFRKAFYKSFLNSVIKIHSEPFDNISVTLPKTDLPQKGFPNQEWAQLGLELTMVTVNTALNGLVPFISGFSKVEKVTNYCNAYSWTQNGINYLVFAFRGTLFKRDLNIDFDYQQTTWNTVSGPPFKVHRGYLQLFYEEFGRINDVIQNSFNTKIIFVGHSMGAVLASLFSVYFWNKVSALFVSGCPRFGNNDLINYLSTLSFPKWFLTNLTDIVPNFPPAVVNENIYGDNYPLMLIDVTTDKLEGNHDLRTYLCGVSTICLLSHTFSILERKEPQVIKFQ